jgi:hypothetical protein
MGQPSPPVFLVSDFDGSHGKPSLAQVLEGIECVFDMEKE